MTEWFWAIFAGGAVFLALLVNGFLVEWIASYIVSDEAAEFGGFCFVLGGTLLGSKNLLVRSDGSFDVGMAVGCAAAVIWLGMRMFRRRTPREVSE